MVLSQDFKEFVQLLDEHKVRYLVIGGYAVAFHGHPRYTKNIDVWIGLDKENAEKVYQGYKPLEAEDIADIALFCVTRKPHVLIQNVLVTPTDQATATIVHKETDK